MKIIIIDDDISFLNLFKAKIISYSKKFFDNVSVITTSDTTILQNHCFSIYFLDIDLTNDNGIQIATSIKKKNPTAKIIFTTSRNDLIYNAITVQSFYFIRKNELEGDLAIAFTLLKDYFVNKPFYSFKYESEQIKIYIEDIIFFETNDHLSTIFTNSKQYHIYIPLKELLIELHSPLILQSNRNQCVNISHVIQEKRNHLILDNDFKIKIGKKYKKDVLNCLNDYLTGKGI